jgi:hypothetical protein
MDEGSHRIDPDLVTRTPAPWRLRQLSATAIFIRGLTVVPRGRAKPFVVPAPLGGVVRRTGYEEQPQGTTPDALNFWACHWGGDGRLRCGSRPGLTAFTSGFSGTPYNWCESSFVNSGTKNGILIAASSGAWSWNGSAWSEHITSNVASDFSSVACYQQVAYLARGGETTLALTLTGAAGGGTALDSLRTAGIVAPNNCGIVATAMNRLWLAGDTSNPHVLYSPRIGTPTDWDYTLTDQSAAFTSGGSNFQLFEPITSLMDLGLNCLGIGCRDSFYVLSGNPRGGGTLYRVNSQVGPLMQSAWCKDGQNNTWFLGRDGLYRIPSGCPTENTIFDRVSRDLLPAELTSIQPGSTDYAAIGYDHRFNMIHLSVDFNSGTDVHWSLDLTPQVSRQGSRPWGGMWPSTFAAGTVRLWPVIKNSQSATKSAIVPILAGGGAYQFDTASTESFSSYCDYLFPLAPAGQVGKFESLQATVAPESADITMRWRVGNSAAEAYNSADTVTGASQAIAGLEYWQHPQLTGTHAVVRTTGLTTSRIALEQLAVTARPMGFRRVTG